MNLSQKILARRKKFILPCLGYFYQDPPAFVRGQMQYLFDDQGKQYLDCFSGISVINCGHCNPEITKKITEQINTLQHVCNVYLTEPCTLLAEKLASFTPGNLQKCFFCSTGSEANEGALLLASLYTKRNSYIALSGGLHGRTKLGMSVTGIDMWRVDEDPIPKISFAPHPYCYRCPLHKKYPECDLECANAIEKICQQEKPACLIAEPIQGNAGIVVPPKEYFARVKNILEKYGALLIIDEVQTGFARTGKNFAIENFDVVPDIMSMAKALGNGVPISVFIAPEKIANVFTKASASTLGGNPVSSTAGLAVIDYINRHHLKQKALARGNQLMNGLKALQEKYDCLGDVRGIGLMVGAEFIKKNKEPDAQTLDKILEELKNLGFIVGKNGLARNVMAFQPPLVISKKDIDDVLNALDLLLQKNKTNA